MLLAKTLAVDSEALPILRRREASDFSEYLTKYVDVKIADTVRDALNASTLELQELASPIDAKILAVFKR